MGGGVAGFVGYGHGLVLDCRASRQVCSRRYKGGLSRRRLSEFDVEAGSDSFDMEVLRERIWELERRRNAEAVRRERIVDAEELWLWVLVVKGLHSREDYVTMKVNDGDTVVAFEVQEDAAQCAEMLGFQRKGEIPVVVRRKLINIEDYCTRKGWLLGIVPEGAVDIDSSSNPEVHEIIAEVQGFTDLGADMELEHKRQYLEDLFERN